MTWVTGGLRNQLDSQSWTSAGQYQDFSGCLGKCNPMPYDVFPRKYDLLCACLAASLPRCLAACGDTPRGML
jgi:hypothetical protein